MFHLQFVHKESYPASLNYFSQQELIAHELPLAVTEVGYNGPFVVRIFPYTSLSDIVVFVVICMYIYTIHFFVLFFLA